MLANYNKIV